MVALPGPVLSDPVGARQGHRRTFCALAICLGAVWLAWSAVQGGLHEAALDLSDVVPAVTATKSWRPDAREPVRGGYYDALDAVTRYLALHDDLTVAVVLSARERPAYRRSARKRAYEAIYRLYPTSTDIYYPTANGVYQPFWFESSPDRTPRIPTLFEHDIIVWADQARSVKLAKHRLACTNPEARVYCRRGLLAGGQAER